jgi:hypothetical protein
MDLSTLITALSGGESYREKSGLPEFKDIYAVLIPSVKENLLKKAASQLMRGELIG